MAKWKIFVVKRVYVITNLLIIDNPRSSVFHGVKLSLEQLDPHLNIN